MEISIVIPAWNAQRFLSRTIESVLAQTITAWEMVIVDDGSTDGTGTVAGSYVKIDSRVSLVAQPNGGVGRARNRGLAETSSASPYVIFLDADDVWHEDALETLLGALAPCLPLVGVHGLSRAVDANNAPCAPGELEAWGRDRRGVQGNAVTPWERTAATTFAVLTYRNCIYTPGQALLRRPMLARAGLFDPAAAPCEDWDMWLRLSQLGDFAFVDKVVLDYRWHDSNMSLSRFRMAQGQAYVRRKVLRQAGMTKEHREIALAANWAWFRVASAATSRNTEPGA